MPALDVACPSCGAQPGARCHTGSGRPATAHTARLAAGVPKLTAEQRAEREHEERQYAAQFSPRTMVAISFELTCGCVQGPYDPIPASDAVTHPGRAVICETHDEYAVTRRVDVQLVADEPTLLRILTAAGLDAGSARYVAADQNDAARSWRIRRGLGGGPA